MKESIGNAFVFGLFITFAFLLMFIFSAAINYSRANKVKNKILNYVASYAERNAEVDTNGNLIPIDVNSDDFADQINIELSEIGYQGNFGGWGQNDCPKKEGAEFLNSDSDYHYCIYAYKSERGYYYGVTTFMYFEIPIIGTTLELPLYGETRVIYNLGEK